MPCHHSFASTLEEHSHHPAESSGSECMNCHMSYTSYGLLSALRSHTIDSPTIAKSLETGRPNACNQCHLNRTSAWAADRLSEWYGIPKPELNPIDRSVPASLVWLLSGDAGQRALMAWSMGWEPAQQASDPGWMAL